MVLINGIHRFPSIETVWDARIGRNLKVSGTEEVKATTVSYGDIEVRDALLRAYKGADEIISVNPVAKKLDLKAGADLEQESVAGVDQSIHRSDSVGRIVQTKDSAGNWVTREEITGGVDVAEHRIRNSVAKIIPASAGASALVVRDAGDTTDRVRITEAGDILVDRTIGSVVDKGADLGGGTNRFRNAYLGGSLIEDSDPASSTTTLVNSPPATFRGAYWDAAAGASKDRDAAIFHRMLSTTPTSEIAFQIAGSDVLMVGDRGLLVPTGNVGIGTTGPNSKLTVQGSSSARSDYGIATFEDGNRAGVSFGYDTTNDWAWLYARGVGVAPKPFYLYASKFIFDYGNVGIGTTAPGDKLTIAGGGYLAFPTTDGKTPKIGAEASNWGNLNLITDSDRLVEINYNAPGGVKTTDLFRVYNGATTEVFKIDRNGNVGIGTTAPGARLTVVPPSAGASALAVRDAANAKNVLNVKEDGYIENEGVNVARLIGGFMEIACGKLTGDLISARDALRNILLQSLLADSTNTLRNSPSSILRAAYWDGAKSVDRDAAVFHRMLSTTPTSEIAFQIAGVDYMRVGDGGVKVEKVVFDPGSSVSIAAAGTYTLGVGAWYVNLGPNTVAEIYDDVAAAWVVVIAAGGKGIVISDGSNARLRNTSTTAAESSNIRRVM